MKITPDEIKYVADLSHLDLSDEEIKHMTEQLDKILSYVEKLNALDTKDIQPTTHAISIDNAFRKDEVKESLERKEALANSPVQNDKAFVVSKII